jgi:hypothetical protein
VAIICARASFCFLHGSCFLCAFHRRFGHRQVAPAVIVEPTSLEMDGDADPLQSFFGGVEPNSAELEEQVCPQCARARHSVHCNQHFLSPIVIPCSAR